MRGGGRKGCSWVADRSWGGGGGCSWVADRSWGGGM